MTIRSSSIVFALAIVTLAGVVYSQSTSGGNSKPSQFHLIGSYEKLFGSNLEGMEKPVTKEFNQTPLFEALNQLATGPFHLVADSASFGDMKISTKFDNMPLGKCLDELATMMDARWEQYGRTLKLRPSKAMASTEPGPVVEVEGFPIEEMPQGLTWGDHLDHQEGIRIESQGDKFKAFRWDPKTNKYKEMSEKESKAYSEKLHIHAKAVKDQLSKMKVDGKSFQFAFPHGELSKEHAEGMRKMAEELKKQFSDTKGNFKFDFKIPDGAYSFGDGKPQKWDSKTKKMILLTPEEQAAFDKKMEAFGKDMENWGDKFGKNWAKNAGGHANAFEFHVHKEQIKEWEAQAKKWEDWAKKHEGDFEKWAKEWEKSGGKGHTFVMPQGALKGLSDLPLRLKELENLKGLKERTLVNPKKPAIPGHETGGRLAQPTTGQDISRLLKSVSDDQKAIMKDRGYLKWSELNTEQRNLVGFEPKGEFSLSFTIDGTTLSIKND